jgi:FMN-dependent oxidoreductase (nitrilotriacetate monooxygenase family)
MPPTAAPPKFHLAWFASAGPDEWNAPFASGGGRPWNGRFHVEWAQALERACFDFMVMEDKLHVSEIYGGDVRMTLKLGALTPLQDPAPLAALIGGATRHLGIVPTLSTLSYPPFLLARLCATLDNLTEGRIGWNIVTSGEDAAAQNFGLDKLPERELRYDMADEYLDLVNRLFASWDAGAVVLDRATGTYADHSKVRPVNFEGRWFKCRGPLNTVPGPQGRPLYLQAGASPRGRAFAAQHADAVIGVANGIAGMKAFRDDVRRRAAEAGRDPARIKVLFLVSPVMAETEAEALRRHHDGVHSDDYVHRNLAFLGAFTDVDFAEFDLDEPLPRKLETNGGMGSLDKFQQWGSGKTLRQLVADGGSTGSIPLVGTPEQVADRMAEAMQAVGGDGFLIKAPFGHISRRYLHEVTDGLVPALQRRGVVRTEYTQPTLRDTVLEF